MISLPKVNRQFQSVQNQERALVPWSGGSRRVKDHTQDLIPDDGFHKHGEDIVRRQTAGYSTTRRLPAPKVSKKQDLNEPYGRSPRRGLRLNEYADSDDEDHLPASNLSKKVSSGAKLTDEELISKYLGTFTTLQAKLDPTKSKDIARSPASAVQLKDRRGDPDKAPRAQMDAVRFSLPAARNERLDRSPDMSSISPAATTALRTQGKQATETNIEFGRLNRARQEEPATDRNDIVHKRDAGVIHDEPITMTEADEPVNAPSSHASIEHDQPTHLSLTTGTLSSRQDARPDLSLGTRPNDDDVTPASHKRASPGSEEAGEVVPEAEPLPRALGEGQIRRAYTEPAPKTRTTMSRSATVEDYRPETED
ncbi:MAG: hypothetical protein L6R40_008149 [Gallowayella cf. fulva]|nr:MAG: hypothetical protein L6R40_008149 [Xanthomendoza cf. fulva]